DPSVLCLNNKESKVIVGKSLSFLKGSTTGSAGTSSSLDRVDVGLNLTIKPLVASKDKLSLSIDAVLENILPVMDSNNQPITSKQQIKTDSILHHGETIVLGGFVKSYDSVIDDGIPFLSDIPFIGGIFKHSSTITQKDNLLLVITPYIIDDSKSLSSLQTDLGAFGKLQKVYNDSLSSKGD
ncbi:MAG: type II and III secretion system protein, partial [Sulfuricurvum sp.]|nr:type II and III secretion system protein [Sulfuricurvum sp.]